MKRFKDSHDSLESTPSKPTSLDGTLKRQKIEFDFLSLLAIFALFLPVESLFVYEKTSYGFEPVHRYGFVFSKLAQTCHTARSMFRPYLIMLKQVELKFFVCVEYLEKLQIDREAASISISSCQFNWRFASYIWQLGYRDIFNRNVVVSKLPSNY